MKKCLIVFLMFIVFSPKAFAVSNKLVVETIHPFTTMNPTQEISLKAVKEITFINDIKIENGSIVKAKVTEVISAKRLKQDAYFTIQILEYTIPSEKDKSVKIEDAIYATVKPYVPLTTDSVLISAGSMAAGQLVKFGSQGFSLIKGVVTAQEGHNRLVSGVEQVYKDSPLAYVEKGEEMNLNIGDLLQLIFVKDIVKEEVKQVNPI